MPKKRVVFSKRFKETFLGLGVSFATLSFVLGLFILVLFGVFLIRRAIEGGLAGIVAQNKEAPSAALPASEAPAAGAPVPASPVPSAEGLVFASFSDIFSGTGWIDAGRTTMRLDASESAFTFPPDVAWEEVPGGAVGDTSRCIAGRCAEVRGTQLFLDGDAVPRPAALAGASIVNVSVEALATEWAVGFVANEGGKYSASVFTFDGTHFTPVFAGASALASPYRGTLGFGGSDDDWLAVYGAYSGIAYHIRSGIGNCKLEIGNCITDISYLFHERLMSGGFAPRILKSGSGANTVWYVYGGKRFIKLFQNGTDGIVGAVDLSDSLPGSVEVMDAAGLVARVNEGGVSSYYRLVDRGFDVSGALTVVSKNINTYPDTEVPVVVRLGTAPSSLLGAQASFYVSNSGSEWEKVLPEREFAFPDPQGKSLFWKAEFKPSGDPAKSPFLKRIDLDYRVKFIK
jgi:hypothetical protein